MEASDAVFFGEVVSVEENKKKAKDGVEYVDSITATFTVLKAWKGVTTDTVKVWTSGHGDSCGVAFEAGTPYVVYARAGAAAGQWVTGLCSRTQPAWNCFDIPELDRETSLDILGSTGAPDMSLDGFIIRIRNRERAPIYVLAGSRDARSAQVRIGGNWMPYAPNAGLKKRAELSSEEAAAEFRKWQDRLKKIEPSAHMARVEPGESLVFFVASVSDAMEWRVGCRYLTQEERNQEMDVRRSGRMVWSPALGRQKIQYISTDQVKGEVLNN